MSMLPQGSIEGIEVDNDWRDEVIEVGKSEYLRGLKDAKKAILKLKIIPEDSSTMVVIQNIGLYRAIMEIEKLIDKSWL